MLAPETRTLLSDALRPPEGFSLDVAVATTYSLDLTTLLLAPLSFALFDYESEAGPEAVNPLQLLDSVSRYADKISVFVQAGAIAVPPGKSYRLFPFIEESVLEVAIDGGLFHPKVWALRFSNTDGAVSHRLLVLSRNLTFDNSWDTVLRVEESPSPEAVNGGPVADFLEGLNDLTLAGLTTERAAQLHSLSASLRSTTFAPPAPFTTMEFLAFGTRPQTWPFPTQFNKVLAITPFVSQTMLKRLGHVAAERQLVSRDRTLEELGGAALDGWTTHVLDPATEPESSEPSNADAGDPMTGLHAKTYVFDHAMTATVFTGSVNLTNAALNRNVEFAARMEGPLSTCGTSAMLEGSNQAPGFGALLAPYTVQSAEGTNDGAADLEWQIAAYHQTVAAAGPTLAVQTIDTELAKVALTFGESVEPFGESIVRPLSIDNPQPLDGRDHIWQLARVNLTPFIVVETVVKRGDLTAKRVCVLKAQLTGHVGDRRKEALNSVLRSREDVIRFLLFLLGDPRFVDVPAEAGAGIEAFFGVGGAGSWDNLALLEPLMRAVGRDSDALIRVKSLMDHLDSPDAADGLIPTELKELWDVLWLVHEERISK